MHLETTTVAWMAGFDHGKYGPFEKWPERAKEAVRHLIDQMSQKPASEWMDSATGKNLREIKRCLGRNSEESLRLDKIITDVETAFLARGGIPFSSHKGECMF